VTFVDGDATAMPFRDRSFDLIVSNLGLNNFTEPAAALAECRRVSRPGAHIALTTNLQGTMAEFYAIFRTILDASAAAALDAHIAHRATIAGIFALLQQTRFEPTHKAEESITLRFANGTALLCIASSGSAFCLGGAVLSRKLNVQRCSSGSARRSTPIQQNMAGSS
jgi:arsenite methyltransferase